MRRRRRGLPVLPALAALLALGGLACATGGGAPAPGAAQAADAADAREAEAEAQVQLVSVDPEAGAGAREALPDDADEADGLAAAFDAARALAAAVLEERAPDWDPSEREGVARLLARAEREHGLPVLMVLALIEQESHFRPRARGPTGALGVMQIKPFVARDVARRHDLPYQGARTLFDPVENVRLGLRYLGELHDAFESAEHALAAWNMGPTRLRQRLRSGHDRGPYVQSLLDRWSAFRSEFGSTETAIGG